MDQLYEKIIVAVDAHYPVQGNPKPVRIYWEDGRVFEIEHSSEPIKAASLKVGSAGLLYHVKIPGEDVTYNRDLWFVGNTWFVEKEKKCPA